MFSEQHPSLNWLKLTQCKHKRKSYFHGTWKHTELLRVRIGLAMISTGRQKIAYCAHNCSQSAKKHCAMFHALIQTVLCLDHQRQCCDCNHCKLNGFMCSTVFLCILDVHRVVILFVQSRDVQCHRRFQCKSHCPGMLAFNMASPWRTNSNWCRDESKCNKPQINIPNCTAINKSIMQMPYGVRKTKVTCVGKV